MTSLEEILGSRQAALAGALAEATEYTDSLLAPLDDDELMRQFTPLQSPLVWDIAHIAHYEELWLVRKITGVTKPTGATAEDMRAVSLEIASLATDLLERLPPRRQPPKTVPPLRRPEVRSRLGLEPFPA